MEEIMNFVDDKTLASRFLQQKFGGHYVSHAVDTNYYDPSTFDKSALRKEWGIEENAKIAAFIGTPRPHKGLENLLKAVKEYPTKIRLLLTGDPLDGYIKHLLSIGRDHIKFVGQQPKKLEPQLLCLEDVVVPQGLSHVSMAQTPAKVFSAMAMAKPIIATSVSDLPQILGNCGVLMKSNTAKEIKDGLSLLLNDENECARMGRMARERCVQQFSFDSVENKLTALVEAHLT
jgi:glycosyltransferase involved in cell wall biosynthesis